MTRCNVCMLENVDQIDQAIRDDDSIAEIARRFELARDPLYRHRLHVITRHGLYAYQGQAEHLLTRMQVRFNSGYNLAIRWKNANLYAALLKEQNVTIRLLLEVAGALKKLDSQAQAPIQAIDATTARQALVNAGWTRPSDDTSSTVKKDD